MAFATIGELTEWLGPDSIRTNHGAALSLALSSAEDDVRNHCGQDFVDYGSASARWFHTHGLRWVDVDPFHTVTGLVVATDDNDDGTAETTWNAADYVVEPVNGRRNGQVVSFDRIVATGTRLFPRTCSGRPAVQVTARWGWASVPDPVKQATLIQAAADFMRRNSPQGVAGFDQFGVVRVRRGMDPDAARLLQPYRTWQVACGIAG